MKNNFKIHNYRILQNENNIFISIEKNNLILDTKELLVILNSYTKQDKQSIQEYNVFIALYGYILTGGAESNLPYNECFFGELDSKGSLIESKPIYQLISETDSNNAESNNTKVYNDKTDSNSIESKTHNKESSNTLSTINIFLGSSSLTILNYSLLESSLNIKLECTSKESKEILEREKITIKKDSSLTAQNDNSTSTALLHLILEDNGIKLCYNYEFSRLKGIQCFYVKNAKCVGIKLISYGAFGIFTR